MNFFFFLVHNFYAKIDVGSSYWDEILQCNESSVERQLFIRICNRWGIFEIDVLKKIGHLLMLENGSGSEALFGKL